MLSARQMPLGGQHIKPLSDTNSNWGLFDRPGAEAGRVVPGPAGRRVVEGSGERKGPEHVPGGRSSPGRPRGEEWL